MIFSSTYAATIPGGHLVLDPHEHQFRVEVRCEGDVHQSGECEGMVVDFRRIAAVMEDRIRPFLENRMLVQSNAHDSVPQMVGARAREVAFRPTVERIAQWCLEELVTSLGPGDAEKVAEVRVFENDRCWATCRP